MKSFRKAFYTLVATLGLMGVSSPAGAAVINAPASQNGWAYQFIDSAFTNAFGGYLFVGNTGPTSPHSQQSYVQFDLASLAGYTSADVTSATLNLYVADTVVAGFGANPSETYSVDIDVHQATSAWPGSATLKWSNKPTLGAVAGSFEVDGPNQWVQVDLTDLVGDWIDGTATNFGVGLVSPTMVRDANNVAIAATFSSSISASNHPYLSVSVVPEPTAAVLLASSGLLMVMRRRR